MKFTNPLSDEDYKERVKPREEDIRGPYFRDQTAIIHSLPYRRLKHKTQVFFSPKNDHVCTRIEHSLHVATIAATIARGLDLNEEMTYAIGLAHDLGHAPFGHSGERALNDLCGDIGGFVHELHGFRMVDKLGNRGKSLNLTYGVQDGIICHCGESPDQILQPRSDKIPLNQIKKKGEKPPCSYEGCVVRIADKIAYLGRDLEDAINCGFIDREIVPKLIKNFLGETNGEIIDTLVIDVINTSKQKGAIALSNEKFDILMNLSQFSIKNIYRHKELLQYELFCEEIIKRLFHYLEDIFGKWGYSFNNYEDSLNSLDKRFGKYLKHMKELYQEENASPKRIILDYVAGMSDGYAIHCMKDISLPNELSFDR